MVDDDWPCTNDIAGSAVRPEHKPARRFELRISSLVLFQSDPRSIVPLPCLSLNQVLSVSCDSRQGCHKILVKTLRDINSW